MAHGHHELATTCQYCDEYLDECTCAVLDAEAEAALEEDRHAAAASIFFCSGGGRMLEPLEGAEAYVAGITDHARATRHAIRAVKDKLVPESEQNDVYRRELSHLWQQRIDRGELPPLQTGLRPARKAA